MENVRWGRVTVFMAALLVLGFLTAGCGAKSFHLTLFPTVDIAVTNICAASTVFVKPLHGAEVAIKYGQPAVTIRLERYLGDDGQAVLTARGVGDDGTSLGSVSRIFYLGQSGRREDYWEIGYLHGGTRSCYRR